jgi:acetyl-CoA carboxylase carboxyl transferase subunit alpha
MMQNETKKPPRESVAEGHDANKEGENSSQADRLRKAWGVVEKSRHPQRPHALDYIQSMFSEFEELKGDRTFGEDAALVAGVGILRPSMPGADGTKVFFLGHQKGRNTKQKIERNFGMAKPEGYRKAMRIMSMAERFKKPILTLIDTPGAFPGIGAEERGQSEAIASSILRLLNTRVPTVGVVIGEGGSGGALAVGVTDRLLMLENSIYSVISPESCAAILWDNAGEAKKAAAALKMSARETFDIRVCDEVVPEEGEGAHSAPEATAKALLARVNWHFSKLMSLDTEELLRLRQEKYRKIDAHLIGLG